MCCGKNIILWPEEIVRMEVEGIALHIIRLKLKDIPQKKNILITK